MASNDPQFEQKAAAIIGLLSGSSTKRRGVLHQMKRAPFRRLDRLGPATAAIAGERAEKHGFEYHRHGTLLAVGAALNPKNRRGVRPNCSPDTPAGQEFVAFLEEVVDTQPARARSTRHP